MSDSFVYFARIGESLNTIKKIAYGQRQPSLPLAVKIKDGTAGNVTEAELLFRQEAAE